MLPNTIIATFCVAINVKCNILCYIFFIIERKVKYLIMEVKKQVGQRLAQARKQAKLTQQQVAEKMNILRQAYARYENGIFELNYEQIIMLCKLFDCSSDYLLGLADI